MAVAVRGVSTGDNNGTSTVDANGYPTVPIPAATQSGDVLYVFVGVDDNAPTWTTPSGWTRVYNGGVATHYTQVFRRVWNTGDPTSYKWAPSPGTVVVACVALSGVDTTNFEDVAVVGKNTTTGSTAMSSTSAGVTAAGGMALTAFLMRPTAANGTSATAVPSGTTEILDQNQAWISWEVSQKAWTAAGSSGSVSATASQAVAYTALTVPVRAAAASAPAFSGTLAQSGSGTLTTATTTLGVTGAAQSLTGAGLLALAGIGPAGREQTLGWTVNRTVNVSLPTDGTPINTAWAAAISAAVAGDRLLIPAGNYVANGNLDVQGKYHVLIEFAGPTTITHQDPAKHGLRFIGTNSCAVKGIPSKDSFTDPTVVFKTTGVSGRDYQDLQGNATLSIDQDCFNLQFQDLMFQGAKGAGVFNYGGHDIDFNRVFSVDSLADGFHSTRGAYNVTGYDCTSRNNGDDGVAVVHYAPRDPASYQSHDVTFTRHRVLGNTHGRGMAVINAINVRYQTCFISTTSAAGLWIANEPNGTAANTRVGVGNVTASDIYIYGGNYEATVDHGSWGVWNGDTANLSMSGIVIGDVVTENPGSTNPVRVYGKAGDSATVTRWTQYGSPTVGTYISGATANGQGTWTTVAGGTSHPNAPQWLPSRPAGYVAPVVNYSGTLTIAGDGSLALSGAKTGYSGTLALAGDGLVALSNPRTGFRGSALTLTGSGTIAQAIQRVTVGPVAVPLAGAGSTGLVPTRIVVPRTGSVAVPLSGGSALSLPAGKPGFTDVVVLTADPDPLTRTPLRVVSAGTFDRQSVGTLVVADPNSLPVWVLTSAGAWRPVKGVNVWNGRSWLRLPASRLHIHP